MLFRSPNESAESLFRHRPSCVCNGCRRSSFKRGPRGRCQAIGLSAAAETEPNPVLIPADRSQERLQLSVDVLSDLSDLRQGVFAQPQQRPMPEILDLCSWFGPWEPETAVHVRITQLRR